MLFLLVLLSIIPLGEATTEHVDSIELNKTTLLLPQQGLTKCSVKENEMADVSVAEVWKPVPGKSDKFEVSNLGKLRSLDRVVKRRDGRSQSMKGRVKAFSTVKGGYKLVHLEHGNAKLISRLVYEVFVGPIADGLEINHIDGDKNNNSLANLEAVTPSENCRHRDRTGLRKAASGSAHGAAKLTEADVVKILHELRTQSQLDVSRMFGVSHSTVHLIAKNKTWKHVPRSTEQHADCIAVECCSDS